MWQYSQRSGLMGLELRNEVFSFQGYCGRDKGLNNPEMQCVKNVGPLPRGLYTILEPIDTATHGPYVMWLIPDGRNAMCGRAGFGIHGDRRDAMDHPRQASQGCIILPIETRRAIWASDVHTLEVVE